MAFDQTMIAIRERRQVDLFDLALMVIRRRPLPIFWATLAGVAPFVALNAWLFGVLGEGHASLALILWWVEAPLALAPLTLVLGGMMFGQTPSPRAVARQLVQAALGLLWTHGLLRLVPLYWLPPRLVFANEILLLERAGWLKLWKRGGRIALGREGNLFFLDMIYPIAVWALALGAYFGLGRLIQAVLAEPLTWDIFNATALTGLTFQLPLWVAAAYFAVVRFLTYIDQRIRLEGWEVELRLRAAGEALAEARRW